MMESHEFCDHCPGCRPAMLDAVSRQPLPPDHPLMIAVDRVWDRETSHEERKAFIEVTLHNSRTSEDMRLASTVFQKFQQAWKAN